MIFFQIKKLHISPVFLSVVAFFFIVDTSFYTLLLLLCAFAHELGHYLTGRALGAEVEGVWFRPFGINIVLRESTRISYWDEIRIALSGPLVNLLLAGGVYLWCLLFGLFDAAGFLIFINLALAGINLLPVDCLDGGRAVRSLLLCLFSIETADRLSLCLSLLTLIPLSVSSAVLVSRSGYNLSLAVITLFLLCRILLGSFRRISVTSLAR